MKKLNSLQRGIIALSAVALITTYFVPLWQILMWAPQYPEGLEMKIWINNLSGEVKTISALNHYIGMKVIEVSMFPEFEYMIYIVAFIVAIGGITVLINRYWGLYVFALTIYLAGLCALIDFYLWGYDYGHNLNPEAPIKIEGMSYQPPVIGTKILLNFTAYSGPDIGGWIFIAVAIILSGLIIYQWGASCIK